MYAIKQNASKTHAEKSRAKKVVPESNSKQFVPSKLDRPLTDVVKQKLDEKLGGTNWTP